VSNGIVNAIVLPHTLRFNEPATQATSARIAESFGHPSAAAAADVLASLLAPLPIPHRLRDIGLAQADLDVIASAAMSDFFISRNPQRVQGAADVRGILDAAW
jgi:alcohol dehydrogenase class IV